MACIQRNWSSILAHHCCHGDTSMVWLECQSTLVIPQLPCPITDSSCNLRALVTCQDLTAILVRNGPVTIAEKHSSLGTMRKTWWHSCTVAMDTMRKARRHLCTVVLDTVREAWWHSYTVALDTTRKTCRHSYTVALATMRKAYSILWRRPVASKAAGHGYVLNQLEMLPKPLIAGIAGLQSNWMFDASTVLN